MMTFPLSLVRTVANMPASLRYEIMDSMPNNYSEGWRADALYAAVNALDTFKRNVWMEARAPFWGGAQVCIVGKFVHVDW